MARWWREPTKIVHGFTVLLAGRHMIDYSATLVSRYRALDLSRLEDPVPVGL